MAGQFPRRLARTTAAIRRDRVLTLAVLGNTYFFFLGALIQQYTIYAYGKDLLASDRRPDHGLADVRRRAWHRRRQFRGGLSLRQQDRIRPDPARLFGMTVFGAFLALPGRELHRRGRRTGALRLLRRLLHRAHRRPDSTPARPHGERARCIAASNLLSFVGIFLAAGVFFLLAGLLAA